MLALLLISTALSILAFEGAVRLCIKPSPSSYGTLLGRDLPPLRVVPAHTTVPAATAPANDRDPQAIAWADLQGSIREDPILGYTPLERATSPHGWWIANNIGARSTIDTSAETTPGKRRVLVFGESFASGSRVRQEDAWASVLAAGAGDLEVVNLAVDGYGMGQSFLRFRERTSSINYDVAMLVFVPHIDLWRDINTIRSLARPSWNSYIVMPRFVVKDGRLTLIKSPYEVGTDVYRDNAAGLSQTLRHHLRAYDRFYFDAKFESAPLLGNLILWKLAATAYFTRQKAALLHSMSAGHIDLDSEAMRISRKIFAAMRDETHARGKQFVLVILPEHHQLRKVQRSTWSAQNWERVVAASCDGGIQCIDLTPALLRVPPEELDKGYDKTHYGPRANRIVAAAVEDGLRHLDAQ